MKTTWNRWGWCALLALSGVAARAGAPAAPATTTLPSSSSSPSSPASSDSALPRTAQPAPPDGIEFSPGDPEHVAEQTMAIQAQQRAAPALSAWQATQDQQAAADDRDWMLRDYTARLKQAGLAAPTAPDPGTVSQPSDGLTDTPARATDPLASPLDASTPQPPLPATPTPSSTTSRDTKQELTVAPLSSFSSLQPILPPLNSPVLKAPRDAWGTEPAASDTFMSPLPPTPPTLFNGENSGSSSSMDVPGLTAAESGMGPAAGSLEFEPPLPGEPGYGQKKTDDQDQNNLLVPTAPTGDLTEFFKKQSEGLKAPTAPTVMQPLTVVAKPLPPAQPERAPQPVITGLRSHVDDPFDILRQ